MINKLTKIEQQHHYKKRRVNRQQQLYKDKHKQNTQKATIYITCLQL